MLEPTVSWFPIEPNRLKPEYHLPPNNKPNLKYYLEKVFKNCIEESGNYPHYIYIPWL